MKRVRATSAESYREIVKTISQREQIVLHALQTWTGDAPTAYELFNALMKTGLVYDLNSVRPRLTELEARGLVEHGDKRTCRISGKSALTWRIAHPTSRRAMQQQELSLR